MAKNVTLWRKCFRIILESVILRNLAIGIVAVAFTRFQGLRFFQINVHVEINFTGFFCPQVLIYQFIVVRGIERNMHLSTTCAVATLATFPTSVNYLFEIRVYYRDIYILHLLLFFAGVDFLCPSFYTSLYARNV